MKKTLVLRSLRRKLMVQRGNRAELTDLPFAPGSEIEVIVVGPQVKKLPEPVANIYNYTESLVRKKRLPRYSMRQIEKIIHDSRQSRG